MDSHPHITSDVRVRMYEPSDTEAVVRCLQELRDHLCALDDLAMIAHDAKGGERDLQYLLRKIEDGSGILLVALFKDRIVGCVGGIVQEAFPIEIELSGSPRTAKIVSLYVDPAFRGLKIGRTLVLVLEKYFRSRNCGIAFLDVHAFNESVIAFYKKMGFHPRNVVMGKVYTGPRKTRP